MCSLERSFYFVYFDILNLIVNQSSILTLFVSFDIIVLLLIIHARVIIQSLHLFTNSYFYERYSIDLSINVLHNEEYVLCDRLDILEVVDHWLIKIFFNEWMPFVLYCEKWMTLTQNTKRRLSFCFFNWSIVRY